MRTSEGDACCFAAETKVLEVMFDGVSLLLFEPVPE